MDCFGRGDQKQRRRSHSCNFQKCATELRAIVPIFASERGEAIQYTANKYNEAIIFVDLPTDDGREPGRFGTRPPCSSV